MVEKLFSPKKIVKKYVGELLKVGIHPERVLLYGSYANETADKWSDIDLVVISEDFAKILPLKRLEILSLATWKVGAPIEALGYTPQEIKEHGENSIIWEAIQNNHKIIYKKAA